MITKVKMLDAIKSEVSTAKFNRIKAKQLPEITTFYIDMLVKKLPPKLGIPYDVAITLSPEKLIKFSATYEAKHAEKEIKKVASKVSKGGKRQIAVNLAIIALGEENFPINYDLWLDTVRACYSFAFYDLNGSHPTNTESLATLYEEGFITTIDGTDEKTAWEQMETQGYYAARNCYSHAASQRMSSHKRPELFGNRFIDLKDKLIYIKKSN